MKSQKGITMVSLGVYIVVSIIVVATLEFEGKWLLRLNLICSSIKFIFILKSFIYYNNIKLYFLEQIYVALQRDSFSFDMA